MKRKTFIIKLQVRQDYTNKKTTKLDNKDWSKNKMQKTTFPAINYE